MNLSHFVQISYNMHLAEVMLSVFILPSLKFMILNYISFVLLVKP